VRHRSCVAFLLTFLGFLFVTTLALGQDAESGSSTSTSTTIPDAPSNTQATTCIENNGKSCPEWVHKLVGQYPPLSVPGKRHLQRDPSTVHFWTYRGLDEPPLRTNKQVFRSKLFIATHVGGAIAMIVACRNSRSREEWHSEVPAVAALFGMDYLQFRFIGGPNALAAPIYEMIHYGRASTR